MATTKAMAKPARTLQRADAATAALAWQRLITTLREAADAVQNAMYGTGGAGVGAYIALYGRVDQESMSDLQDHIEGALDTAARTPIDLSE